MTQIIETQNCLSKTLNMSPDPTSSFCRLRITPCRPDRYGPSVIGKYTKGPELRWNGGFRHEWATKDSQLGVVNDG